MLCYAVAGLVLGLTGAVAKFVVTETEFQRTASDRDLLLVAFVPLATYVALIAPMFVLVWRDPRFRAGLLGATVACLVWGTPHLVLNLWAPANSPSSEDPGTAIVILLVMTVTQLVMAVIITSVMRLYRRVPPPGAEICMNCGYTLCGLRDPGCPECGSGREGQPPPP